MLPYGIHAVHHSRTLESMGVSASEDALPITLERESQTLPLVGAKHAFAAG